MVGLSCFNIGIFILAAFHYHTSANNLISYESLKGKERFILRMKEIFSIFIAVIVADIALFAVIILSVGIYRMLLH